jgi:CubicO group peptidase (beta-lactamase class C family)
MKLNIIVTSIAFLLVACSKKSNDNLKNDSFSIESAKSQIIIEGSVANSIDSLLKEEMNIGFSGTVCVMLNGTNVFQNGYGWTDSLKTVAITPSTGFYLASTTKGFTGVTALIAQEKGLIKTTDPLIKIDPQINKEYANMTIQQMLTHTSGLSDEYETFGSTQRDENIQLIYGIPLGKKDKFKYTGAGFWLSAALIDKAGATSYEEYVKKKLFQPANMGNSNFWFEVDENDNTKYAQKLEKFPPNDIPPNWGFRGSSGIITTIIDLKSYFISLISAELLNESSLEELFGPHLTLNSGIGVGYGWFTSETSRGTKEIWSRGGEGFGHNSAIRWFVEEDVVILVLTNCGQIEGEDYEANKTVSDKIEKLIFQKKHQFE